MALQVAETNGNNPFGGSIATRPVAGGGGGALVEIEQKRAMQEIQAAIVMARQLPRDEKMAMDRILNACCRPGLAEKATYVYARGGTNITGPSIRLAEAIAQCWGNIQFGIQELDQRPGVSTVQAFAWDMETNTRQIKTFQVKHTRYTKKGSYNLEDPRDIYELVANQGARRLRACILGVIPGDVIESAVTQCHTTMATSWQPTPELIKKMLDEFTPHGVTKEMIEVRIQRRVDAIQAQQMIHMKEILNSLNDGMSTVADWFEVAPAPELETKTDTVKNKIKQTVKAAKEASVDDLPPANPETGEIELPEGQQALLADNTDAQSVMFD